MRRLFVTGLLAGFLLNGPVSAQYVCMPHAEVEKQLSVNYGEVPIALGLGSSGAVFEVFATADGMSWTIIVTSTNGTSCLLAEGVAWENIKRKQKQELSL